METITQPKITGYRQLSPTEAQLMNDIKALGDQHIAVLIEKIKDHLHAQACAAYDLKVGGDMGAETDRIATAEPNVWLERGREHLQTGLMLLTRSVAQPGSF